MRASRTFHRKPSRGVVALEFALVAAVLLPLLIGIIEVGRVMWLWNAGGEASRLAARLAAVCDLNDADIAQRVAASLGTGAASVITPTITYEPAGCHPDTCQRVQVTLTAKTVTTFIPFVDFAPVMPPQRTTLPRESLSSTDNTLCSPP
ncbi:MAG: hypothetical protein QG612_1182 [Pseudomonadota bacterium]|nr:hypothetical protein [Pseudomonadota bacterium]